MVRSAHVIPSAARDLGGSYPRTLEMAKRLRCFATLSMTSGDAARCGACRNRSARLRPATIGCAKRLPSIAATALAAAPGDGGGVGTEALGLGEHFGDHAPLGRRFGPQPD